MIAITSVEARNRFGQLMYLRARRGKAVAAFLSLVCA